MPATLAVMHAVRTESIGTALRAFTTGRALHTRFIEMIEAKRGEGQMPANKTLDRKWERVSM